MMFQIIYKWMVFVIYPLTWEIKRSREHTKRFVNKSRALKHEENIWIHENELATQLRIYK